jgi:hypothetical protein
VSRRRVRNEAIRFTITGLLLLRPAGAALAQCAMCGSAAGSGQVGRGLSISVLFLLAALILTVGWLVALVVRARARPPGADDPSRREPAPPTADWRPSSEAPPSRRS